MLSPRCVPAAKVVYSDRSCKPIESSVVLDQPPIKAVDPRLVPIGADKPTPIPPHQAWHSQKFRNSSKLVEPKALICSAYTWSTDPERRFFLGTHFSLHIRCEAQLPVGRGVGQALLVLADRGGTTTGEIRGSLPLGQTQSEPVPSLTHCIQGEFPITVRIVNKSSNCRAASGADHNMFDLYPSFAKCADSSVVVQRLSPTNPSIVPRHARHSRVILPKIYRPS